MKDKRIIKLVPKDPCADYAECDYPKDVGYGTVAVCGRCGRKATLDYSQRENRDVWVLSYPQAYSQPWLKVLK